MTTTAGTLLGGKIAYTQPEGGYRTGIEPILLAASVPARPGERVVEAGTGAGAGLLALSARVPGLAGTGIEIDPALAALARQNMIANGRMALRIETADIAKWAADGLYDHAFANPPWHDQASTPSPEAARRRAKRAADGLLAQWSRRLGACLRRRGTLSLILPASSLAEGIIALEQAKCTEITLLPLWKRAGEDARLIILRGTHLGLGGCSVQAGLVLHRQDGGFTGEAEALLRDNAGLSSRSAARP